MPDFQTPRLSLEEGGAPAIAISKLTMDSLRVGSVPPEYAEADRFWLSLPTFEAPLLVEGLLNADEAGGYVLSLDSLDPIDQALVGDYVEQFGSVFEDGDPAEPNASSLLDDEDIIPGTEGEIRAPDEDEEYRRLIEELALEEEDVPLPQSEGSSTALSGDTGEGLSKEYQDLLSFDPTPVVAATPSQPPSAKESDADLPSEPVNQRVMMDDLDIDYSILDEGASPNIDVPEEPEAALDARVLEAEEERLLVETQGRDAPPPELAQEVSLEDDFGNIDDLLGEMRGEEPKSEEAPQFAVADEAELPSGVAETLGEDAAQEGDKGDDDEDEPSPRADSPERARVVEDSGDDEDLDSEIEALLSDQRGREEGFDVRGVTEREFNRKVKVDSDASLSPGNDETVEEAVDGFVDYVREHNRGEDRVESVEEIDAAVKRAVEDRMTSVDDVHLVASRRDAVVRMVILVLVIAVAVAVAVVGFKAFVLDAGLKKTAATLLAQDNRADPAGSVSAPVAIAPIASAPVAQSPKVANVDKAVTSAAPALVPAVSEDLSPSSPSAERLPDPKVDVKPVAPLVPAPVLPKIPMLKGISLSSVGEYGTAFFFETEGLPSNNRIKVRKYGATVIVDLRGYTSPLIAGATKIGKHRIKGYRTIIQPKAIRVVIDCERPLPVLAIDRSPEGKGIGLTFTARPLPAPATKKAKKR